MKKLNKKIFGVLVSLCLMGVCSISAWGAKSRRIKAVNNNTTQKHKVSKEDCEAYVKEQRELEKKGVLDIDFVPISASFGSKEQTQAPFYDLPYIFNLFCTIYKSFEEEKLPIILSNGIDLRDDFIVKNFFTGSPYCGGVKNESFNSNLKLVDEFALSCLGFYKGSAKTRDKFNKMLDENKFNEINITEEYFDKMVKKFNDFIDECCKSSEKDAEKYKELFDKKNLDTLNFVKTKRKAEIFEKYSNKLRGKVGKEELEKIDKMEITEITDEDLKYIKELYEKTLSYIEMYKNSKELVSKLKYTDVKDLNKSLVIKKVSAVKRNAAVSGKKSKRQVKKQYKLSQN